ncbi:flagellar FliJ family protein [Nocardioides pantholopis]|uniref:flagellar FliJ family protein n=1 Tax=Nocardioides pantholopis TaxID=2483798 RepID=UPI000F093D40|nr:flagellar FliJ family protein [Nocardioides pantholopis]
MSARHDRGLRAVARVREVRERDSRIGLQGALGEQREREAAADRLADGLAAQAGESGGSGGSGGSLVDGATYLAQRTMLQALAGAVSAARSEAESAAVLSAAATAHWQADHARLSAVEGLLESRADQRRAEAARHEAKEQDDAAGRQWLRRTREGDR